MTRIEKIYAMVLPEMKTQGIEDTIDNRITFLTGLYVGWKDDAATSTDKTFDLIVLLQEISNLKWTKIRPTL